jgi:hypothetical protein
MRINQNRQSFGSMLLGSISVFTHFVSAIQYRTLLGGNKGVRGAVEKARSAGFQPAAL